VCLQPPPVVRRRQERPAAAVRRKKAGSNNNKVIHGVKVVWSIYYSGAQVAATISTPHLWGGFIISRSVTDTSLGTRNPKMIRWTKIYYLLKL
jgi:hypothetical protein